MRSVEGLGKILGKALRGCPLDLPKGGRVGFQAGPKERTRKSTKIAAQDSPRQKFKAEAVRFGCVNFGVIEFLFDR